MHENKLTIGLPVYDAMPYLPEAVDSILGQTHKEFEFLIINDGSNDGSAEYLATIKDKRVKVLHQENKGLGATLNRIIELCQTKYIARMDADDIALPERLERQLAFMEAHPEVLMLGTQIMFLCNKNTVRHIVAPLDHDGIVRALTQGRVAAICHPTIMCRTDAARHVGGYRIRVVGEELDFFLRMSEMGQVANLPDVLLHYRINADSVVMRRWHEVRRGHAYGLACARNRRAHLPEPSFEEFCIKWQQRSIIGRSRDLSKRWANYQYRKALFEEGRGHWARSWGRKVIAGLCDPKKGFGYLCRLLRYG